MAMTVEDVLSIVRTWSKADQRRLMQKLMWMERGLELASSKTPTRRLSEFEGVGAEIWEGVDVEAYINDLRDDWERKDEA